MSRPVPGKAILAVLLFVSIATSPAAAVNKTWVDNFLFPKHWGNPAQWNPFGAPTPSDSVTFNLTAEFQTYYPELRPESGDPVINDLFVKGTVILYGIDLFDLGRTLHLNGTGGSNSAYIGPGTLELLATHLNAAGTVKINHGGVILVAGTSVSGPSSLISGGGVQIGTDGTGTLVVDRALSSVTSTGQSHWGDAGHTANVTFRDGATGTFNGPTYIARNQPHTGTTTGTVDVLSDADLTVSSLALDDLGDATATLSIRDAGSNMNVTGAATVGHAFSGTAVVDVNNNGTFTVGDTLFVYGTGTINVGNTLTPGTLNANGNLLVDDGLLVRNAGSAFNLADGRTMTMQNGGIATFHGSYTTAVGATYGIIGGLSKFEVASGGSVDIIKGSTVNVGAGGLLSAADHIHVGTNGNGTVTVDGLGSSVTAPGQNHWGDVGHTAHVTFSGGATGTFGGPTYIGRNQTTTGTTTGIVNVLSNADLTVNSLALDDQGRANATLNVSGAGSRMIVTGAATVGHATSGTAVVNLNSGGLFTVGGTLFVKSTGTINAGNASTAGDLNVGGMMMEGGLATIRSGSKLQATNGGSIDIGGGATINIGTGGLLSAASHIHVGKNGNGTLYVDEGSSVTAAGESHWGDAGNTAHVTFSKSSIGTFNGPTYIARNNSGVGTTTATVDVLEADLTVSSLALDDQGNANATLNVQGTGSSMIVNGAATVGHPTSGTAVVNLNSGGLFSVGGTLFVKSTGTINAGNVTTAGDVNVGGMVMDGGLVTIRSGSALNLGTGGSGTATINAGTLAGDGTVTGNVQNAGYVAPGTSPGTLTINGNFNQAAAGALNIELASLASFDKLVVNGTATLGGTLNVSLINGFTPSGGQQFTVLTASSVVNNGLLLTGSAASSFNLLVNSTSVILQAISAGVSGDYNGNGIVDAADYVVWRKGGPLQNEGASIGTVDAADYTFWRSHFGQTAGSGAGANPNATVPEPATLVLIMIAAVGSCLKRRRAA